MILNIKKYYKNTFVDVYVIMPNHIHMIIELKQMIDGSMWSSTPTIPQIISTLKCLITKKIGYAIFQRNYYEHIIRNEKECIKVVEYIKNNPLKWKEDELHVGVDDHVDPHV